MTKKINAQNVITYTNTALKKAVIELNKAHKTMDMELIEKAQKAVDEELKNQNARLKVEKYDFIATKENPVFEMLKCGYVPFTRVKNGAKKDETPQFKIIDGVTKLDLLDFINYDKINVAENCDLAIERLYHNFIGAHVKDGKLKDGRANTEMPAILKDITLGVESQADCRSNKSLCKEIDFVLNMLCGDVANKFKAQKFDVKHINTGAFVLSKSEHAKVVCPKLKTFATVFCSVAYKLFNNTTYELVSK